MTIEHEARRLYEATAYARSVPWHELTEHDRESYRRLVRRARESDQPRPPSRFTATRRATACFRAFGLMGNFPISLQPITNLGRVRLATR